LVSHTISLNWAERLLPVGCIHAVSALVFASTVAAQTSVTITSTSATLTLGSDTITFAGITVPLTTTIQPNVSTPLATAPVIFTASPATVADAGHPSAQFHGIVNQTFTVNGVSASLSRVVSLLAFSFGFGHEYIVDSGPLTFNLPQGSLTLSGGQNLFGPVTTPGVLALPGNTDNWFLIPRPTTPNTFVIYTDFPTGALGGLVGNLPGGIPPQQMTLTPNVPATVGYSNFTDFISTFPSSGGGVSTTLVHTVTVNGVSASVVRTVALTLATGLPCPTDTVLSKPPATVTIDLGAAGKVDVTLAGFGSAGELHAGSSCNLQQGIIVVPGGSVAVLLHDVPALTAAIQIPMLSEWGRFLLGALLLGSAWWALRRA
jgi:hypothetical protein